MADKLTRMMRDALARALSEPAGMPLFGARSAPGLFPATASARTIARRCKDEGFLQPTSVSPEHCVITEKGRAWLLAQADPRQVLDDFVRVLEDRQSQVEELTAAARQMAAGLEALKEAVTLLRPQLAGPQIHHLPRLAESQAPNPDAPSPANNVVAHLRHWHDSAPGDCPLPELYRRMTGADVRLTIGRFHDRLRDLHDAGLIYLHPWTGPLYDLPEPPYALLIGHEIAYYASLRTR